MSRSRRGERAALAASRSTDIWDEIAPVLTDIFHNGPPPAPVPTLDNPLPMSINMSTSLSPTHLTLTDYFGHETDAELTFTVTLDNPIATISQWDELISIEQTSSGTATLTVTASDGTNSVTATSQPRSTACNAGLAPVVGWLLLRRRAVGAFLQRHLIPSPEQSERPGRQPSSPMSG